MSIIVFLLELKFYLARYVNSYYAVYYSTKHAISQGAEFIAKKIAPIVGK